MKRALMLMLIGALAAAAIVYGLRLAERASNASVASLLPRGTIAFAHLPDLNKTIDQWHHADIYRIYLEPAVQDFLQKPASHAAGGASARANFRQFEEMQPKNAFIALVSAENNQPKIIGGFQFRCTQDVADRVIADWRTKINPSATREKISYHQHDIEIFRESAFSLAWTRDRNWILAGNDLDEFKALVDRSDGHVKDGQELLGADESFREATAAMPATYSFLFYVQPKTFADRLATMRGALGLSSSANQPTLLEQIRCVCSTTRFEGGKMHDVVYVGRPKQENASLTRSSLALATRTTFFYAASLLKFPTQLGAWSPAGNFMGAGVQKLTNALAAAGVSTEDWSLAFGSELGALLDWREGRHWPSVIFSSAVKDSARAKKIVAALAHGIDEDGAWNETEQGGVRYWTLATTPSLIPLRPVIALSNRVCVAGLERDAVEAAVGRAENPASDLAGTDAYKHAERSLPEPTNFFSFIDPALLYLRLDAGLRPMLFMGAAFLPSVNRYVDLNKLPPPEVITRHLSPIVCSQRYSGKGYVAESIGPITFNQAGLGVGILAVFGTIGYQHGLEAGWHGLGLPGGLSSPSTSSSAAGSSPTPQPTLTP